MAQQQVNVHRATIYRWRDSDYHFANEMDDVHQDVIEELEASLYQRALAGNDLLAMFWLKAHKGQYKDRLQIDLQAVQSEIEQRLRELVGGRNLPATFAVGPFECKLLYAPKSAKADKTNYVNDPIDAS